MKNGGLPPKKERKKEGLISYMGSPKPFSLFCGYFFKENRFLGKLKQLRFSVGNVKAKHFCVG